MGHFDILEVSQNTGIIVTLGDNIYQFQVLWAARGWSPFVWEGAPLLTLGSQIHFHPD